MKTLYININNEQIQSSEELEVLNYDLDNDFFFYIGEKIAKGCNVDNRIHLITDFSTTDNQKDYQQITSQWNEVKGILFSEECACEFKVSLPEKYIHWLKFHPQYVEMYDKNFSHGNLAVISIDLEELYEDSVEALQRKILRKLQRDDFYLEIDEIVFNDDAVTRKSPIVRAIKEKYDAIGLKAYKKWIQENEEKPRTLPKVCEKCKKNPCECQEAEDPFFPLDGITLGETLISAVEQSKLEDFDDSVTYTTNGGAEFMGLKGHLHFIGVGLHECSYGNLPTKWKNYLGFDFGCKYKKCKKILINKGFQIRNELIVDDDHNAIYGIAQNGIYLMVLQFNDKSFSGIVLVLAKCPYCNSNNWGLKDNGAGEFLIPFCEDCGRTYWAADEESEVRDNDDEIDALVCPNCNSDDIEDDGSCFLQYTCNDCGHNWGHDDTVECPECGSDDVENDGFDYQQYLCNDCGHNWGDDEDDEL